MANYRPPTPSPNSIDMDTSVGPSLPIMGLADRAQEILRTIATLNTRSVRAEKVIAKYEHELATVRQLLAQTSSELDETVKVAELLYDVNRRLGAVTDYLLREQGLALSDSEPKSAEALINSLVKRAEADETPKFESGGGNVAGNGGSRPVELGSATMSQ
ncbi:hypothetical protein N7486_011098 [Penicillium sp. IBT 16267x]|nr:hypothetical protein N7486_011098 [Penicillium sp. IBT 16267x]